MIFILPESHMPVFTCLCLHH